MTITLTNLDEIRREDLLTGANPYSDGSIDFDKMVRAGTLTGNVYTNLRVPIGGRLSLIPDSTNGGIALYESTDGSLWTLIETATVPTQYVCELPGVRLTGFGSFCIG